MYICTCIWSDMWHTHEYNHIYMYMYIDILNMYIFLILVLWWFWSHLPSSIIPWTLLCDGLVKRELRYQNSFTWFTIHLPMLVDDLPLLFFFVKSRRGNRSRFWKVTYYMMSLVVLCLMTYFLEELPATVHYLHQ